MVRRDFKIGDRIRLLDVTTLNLNDCFINDEIITIMEVEDGEGFVNRNGVIWYINHHHIEAWEFVEEEPKEHVDHPQHYGGADNPYEAIKVIEAWDLGFCLGNTIKYISRAGKKDPAKEVQDLNKAIWYLQRHIDKLKEEV